MAKKLQILIIYKFFWQAPVKQTQSFEEKIDLFFGCFDIHSCNQDILFENLQVTNINILNFFVESKNLKTKLSVSMKKR